MANLRANNLTGTGGRNAIDGSISFKSENAYLSVTLDAIGTSDFTIEWWFKATDKTEPGTANRRMFRLGANNATGSISINYDAANNDIQWNYNDATLIGASTIKIYDNSWYHIAAVREGTGSNETKLYINGVLSDSATLSQDLTQTALQIGHDSTLSDDFGFYGDISNLRVTKSAVYTAAFTPPTEKLTILTDTILLCCQDSDDPTQEATGKTITEVGDPVGSTYFPSVGVDEGVTFEGDIKMNSQGVMYFPTGTTEQRGRGRGVIFGGYSSPNGYEKDIYYLEIQSMGNAVNFGDLTATRYSGGGCASATRALIGGGRDGPSTNRTNTIEYVTIATTSNVADFGDLTGVNAFNPGGGNQTRGIWMGGSSPTTVDTIEYVTIANAGNATDFGNLRAASYAPATAASPTRMLAMGGGNPSSFFAYIDYVTISTTGNASDFGDMTTARNQNTGVSSNTRAVAMGGAVPSTLSNAMEFVTIASTGDATDFGDLSSGFEHTGSVNNSIRGVQTGGRTPSYVNTLESITIASTGNSSDFGDIPRNNLGYTAGASDSHGGLE